MNNKKEWYLGLDIGTNSIGYAVTDTDYNVLKYKNNAMWGTYIFDEAQHAAERRASRTSRRTLDRRKQRVALLQELMAKEISEVDENFFIRIKQSNLYEEDRIIGNRNTFFDDSDYTDKDYFRQYPTIHHLIDELMTSDRKYDIRLIYLAAAYLLKHRGHFLMNVDKRNISNITNFNIVYDSLLKWFSDMEMGNPFKCESEIIAEILKSKISKTNKQKELKTYISDEYDFLDEMIDMKKVVGLICGGKVRLAELFMKEEYSDIEGAGDFTLDREDADEIIMTLSSELDGAEVEFLLISKNIYDWSMLMNILGDEKTGEIQNISFTKKEIYNQHKEDLKNLKYLIKKYCTQETYYNMFKKVDVKTDNYCRYTGNVSDYLKKNKTDFKKITKTNQENFCKYVSKYLKDISVEECDRELFETVYQKSENRTLCPKQVTTDNRVIPYQLYWNELNIILEKASRHYEFLNHHDEYGSVKDKILDIMEFRIPYYVGPLNSHSKMSWIEKKADEKIYPWNFDDVVDRDGSENNFIRRMTGKCTYLPGEDVLPRYSLLYSKFNVLNEINNIKINETPITVDVKQMIFNEIFMKRKKVTLKNITDFLKIENLIHDGDNISGIDVNVKSSMKSYLDFRKLLEAGILSEEDVENIICRITCTNDRKRLEKWLKQNYKLNESDIKYIAGLKYSEFGRLSRKFLEEIYDVDGKTGEIIEKNIISRMWETNSNLMKLLSYEYGYSKIVEQIRRDYYLENSRSLSQKLDDMYVSNAVKRPIYRTLDIVRELKSIMKTPPEKIFVEMARGNEEEVRKGNSSRSRKTQLTNLINALDGDYLAEKQELLSLLDSFGDDADSRLRSNKLYLYFMQLGKCMYSGETIDLSQLFTNKYDIDHIYPRSKVKDDSLNNKVLVLSEVNGAKTDNYPIIAEIRNRMTGFWKYLNKKNLISEEKYKRLVRNYGFSDSELAGFIARQLVETKQSTKVVAALLKEIFDGSEIVYVKAGLVSEFRQKYDLLKCREVNDFHHAKDAFLNIVVGNVYNVKFTNNPINFIKEEYKNKQVKYNLKLEKMLEYTISRNNNIAWIGTKEGEASTITTVKKTMMKNNIRFVRYSYCQKGALFDLNPLRKGYGQLALKNPEDDSNYVFSKMRDTEKYGGYNGLTSSYFYLVRYIEKKKHVTAFVPVDLVYALSIKTEEDIMKYLTDVRNLDSPELLLDGRKIKYNTLFEIDGYRCHLSAKTGKQIVFKNGQQLVVSYETERYLKRLVKYNERNNAFKGKNNILITEEDKITKVENLEIYKLFMSKIENTRYMQVFEVPLKILKDGIDMFIDMTVEKQAVTLCKLLQLFRCNTSSGKDMSDIGGSNQTGIIRLQMKLSSRNYSTIRIVDQSSTGLYEKKSKNLLEL